MQEGERWDTISWKAYGTVNKIPEIVAANPLIPINDRLTGGTILNLPVLPTVDTKISQELLPPWKKDT